MIDLCMRRIARGLCNGNRITEQVDEGLVSDAATLTAMEEDGSIDRPHINSEWEAGTLNPQQPYIYVSICMSIMYMPAVTMMPSPTTRTATTPRRGGGGGWPSLVEDRDAGVVVVVGATGTGKSKLSVDIGTRFPSEVVNSDKMQLYRGFDITTNKMSMEERKGVPHHLLGELDSTHGVLSPMAFRSLASDRITAVQARRRLPVVAGGSNSFVHSLLAKRYDPNEDPFGRVPGGGGGDGGTEGMRYRCCLLWVDVEWEVLGTQLDRRVDEMVRMGMVEELAVNYSDRRAREGTYRGVEMAIGVREFDKFFLNHPPERWLAGGGSEVEAMGKALEEVKENTRALARRQREKIARLREGMGWEMRRVDATEAVRRTLQGRSKAEVEEAWHRHVMLPAAAEVQSFVGGMGMGWSEVGAHGGWRQRVAPPPQAFVSPPAPPSGRRPHLRCTKHVK